MKFKDFDPYGIPVTLKKNQVLYPTLSSTVYGYESGHIQASKWYTPSSSYVLEVLLSTGWEPSNGSWVSIIS